MEFNFSNSIKNIESNVIREIFKCLSNPNIISFAGGFPGKENIPNKEIAEIARNLFLSCEGKDFLQYGATEGYPKLKESLIKFVERYDIFGIKNDNILITSGGQQAINFISNSFLNEDDVVLTENITYLAALTIFKINKAKVIPIKEDIDFSLDIKDLEEKIEKYKPKLIYLVPTFSNPTGREISIQKRKKIYDIISKTNTVLIEDDPYSELRYSGEKLPSIKSFDKKGVVAYISSFSKTVCPGLRVGYCIADAKIIKRMVICKQNSDVNSPYISQAIINEYISTDKYEKRLEQIKNEYREKRDLMLNCIEKYFPKTFVFNKSNGGLFIYGVFKDGTKTSDLFNIALKNDVVFLTGQVFSVNNDELNAMRLNFSNATLKNIEKGIKRIADSLKELKENK